jgi:hypothetical protein
VWMRNEAPPTCPLPRGEGFIPKRRLEGRR